MKAAMAAHDGTAITALLAPDFISVDISGKSTTASQMIAEVNHLPPDPNRSSSTTLVSIEPRAMAVTVEQRYDMKTVRSATDGTKHNVELITLSKDTWVKSGASWLMDRTVTEEVSWFVDGRLIVHKKATQP